MSTATQIDPATIYELRRFRYDNAPTGLIGHKPTPDDPPASDQEARDLLIFAGRYAQGDPTLPRTLEAHRVVWLVPVEVGAALFGGQS